MLGKCAMLGKCTLLRQFAMLGKFAMFGEFSGLVQKVAEISLNTCVFFVNRMYPVLTLSNTFAGIARNP